MILSAQSRAISKRLGGPFIANPADGSSVSSESACRRDKSNFGQKAGKIPEAGISGPSHGGPDDQ